MMEFEDLGNMSVAKEIPLTPSVLCELLNKPLMDDEIYMVSVDGCDAPEVEHESYDKAAQEAARLCVKLGKVARVLKVEQVCDPDSFVREASDIEEEHALMVERLAKPGEAILATLQIEEADLLHMGFLLAGEVGELLDAMKRHIIYQKPMDRENIVEELGDIEFALSHIRALYKIEREEVLTDNIRKLSSRYASGKYSDKQANERADKSK